MANFGRRILSCRELMAMCSLILLFIFLQRAEGIYSVHPRVEKVDSSQNVMLTVSNDYYLFKGDNIKIYCYCTDFADEQVVRTVELRLNDRNVSQQFPCGHMPPLPLNNVTVNDAGPYQCVTEFTNRTFHRTNAGHLHVLDSNHLIHAPNVQYGLRNSNTTLNCSTINYNESTSITWTFPNSTMFSGRIKGVELEHEGLYMCEVFLSTIDLVKKKPVQFKVIVPPVITNQSPTAAMFTRNEPQNLTVHFQSKTVNETTITWYKDNLPIDSSITEQQDSTNFQTKMFFNPIRRRNKGEYVVVIENTHGIIPVNQRRIEAHFIVEVYILPATPTMVNVNEISDQAATVSWLLDTLTDSDDELADNQTITIQYANGSIAEEKTVGGDIRQSQLSLIPGERYLAQVQAQNQDGSATSMQHPFITLTGAPLMSEVRVWRHTANTLNLMASLVYTGGGSIAHFVVSFRYTGTNDWVELNDNITANAVEGSALMWTAVIMDQRFQDSLIELQVQAVSSNNHISNNISQAEDMVIPGAPEVNVFSSGYDTVTLEVVLPIEGTAPLTSIEVDFSFPDRDSINLTELELNNGAMLKITLFELQDNTNYTLSLAVYNYGGKGVPSQQIHVVTVARPPLPVHGIALVAAGGSFLVITILIIIVVIWKKYSTVKRKKRAYSVAGAEGNTFSSDHAIVKHGGNSSPLSPISPTPPTPSTATSIITPRPSPPGFYPTPPYCSTSAPYLSSVPSFPAVNNSQPPSAFKFDAGGSSRSNSVNQDSDLSESNSPRYTYTFPRSGEGTPQIPRAYDQVDLPLEEMLGELGPGNGGADIRPHRDPIRLTESRVRIGSASTNRSVGRYVDIDSPHLRTQSSHSVATTQTRLTSSDSTSTRDSLSYPRIETNTTDV